MKIATWNLERPNASTAKRNAAIVDKLREIDADILILTETNASIELAKDYNVVYTDTPTAAMYKPGERRVAIYTKYDFSAEQSTYNAATAKCIGIRTPLGTLQVYGTIIGVYGNRRACFKPSLEKQIADWGDISKHGALCIAGDYNISFSDNYYYTAEGREKIVASFSELAIDNLTANLANNIDHIAISKQYMQDRKYALTTWNEDKKLSDHIGVCVQVFE
jgi:endonuclease/exonuclease/phosphatase family metal-dependent hydrolase